MRQEVLAEVAGEFQTPCYVFDLDRLREDVAEMKTLLADRVRLCFAMKANPFLTGEMAEMTDYIEVCSPGDLLVFERTCAYSMTEGMSLFLRRDLPAVVSYCKTEGFRVLRSRMPVYPLNKAADRIL